MQIFLPNPTLETCRQLATNRNEIKEKNNVNNHRVDPKLGDWEAHYLGLRGEAAIAQLCDLKVDSATYLKGDGGVADFKTPKNKTIQIKTRKDFKNKDDIYLFYNHLDLKPNSTFCVCCNRKIRKSEVFLADYSFLVVSDQHDESLMEVLGYISRRKFMKNHIVTNFGYGNRYAVTHKLLTPMKLEKSNA